MCFGIAAMGIEEVKELNTLPGISGDPSAVGFQRVEEEVSIPTTAVQCWQHHTK